MNDAMFQKFKGAHIDMSIIEFCTLSSMALGRKRRREIVDGTTEASIARNIWPQKKVKMAKCGAAIRTLTQAQALGELRKALSDALGMKLPLGTPDVAPAIAKKPATFNSKLSEDAREARRRADRLRKRRAYAKLMKKPAAHDAFLAARRKRDKKNLTSEKRMLSNQVKKAYKERLRRQSFV